jgi:hypothetical protein
MHAYSDSTKKYDSQRQRCKKIHHDIGVSSFFIWVDSEEEKIVPWMFAIYNLPDSGWPKREPSLQPLIFVIQPPFEEHAIAQNLEFFIVVSLYHGLVVVPLFTLHRLIESIQLCQFLVGYATNRRSSWLAPSCHMYAVQGPSLLARSTNPHSIWGAETQNSTAKKIDGFGPFYSGFRTFSSS